MASRQTVHDFAVCEFHAIKPIKRQRQSLDTQLLQNIPCRIRTLMVGNNQLIRIRQAVTHKTLNDIGLILYHRNQYNLLHK